MNQRTRQDTFPKLFLPRRYETLEIAAKEKSIEISNIVQRVDSASTRVETLMRRVRDGGLGQFELFLGKPGSGKTTFFRTLNQFFDGANIQFIPKEVNLDGVPSYIRERHSGYVDRMPVVWVLLDKDNLRVDNPKARDLCENLRTFFRESAGKIVLIWPITDVESARIMADTAWEIGRDSVVDLQTRGQYHFEGLSKKKFFEVADITTRSFNSGRSLESFGLTREVVDPLLAEAATIGEFYGHLQQKSEEINGNYRDILKEKVIPGVWILVAGDDNRDLNTTVATLTQGTENRVDIDRIAEHLDRPSQSAAYLKDWKTRRTQMAYLMRLLDVRLFELSPNVALAALRAFGDDGLKSELKVKASSPSIAYATIQNTRFYRLLIGDEPANKLPPSTEMETALEYMRVQKNAKSGDKNLNKALSKALEYSLGQSGADVSVIAEKQSMEGNLKPDVLLRFADGHVVCLEVTWRTTGRKQEPNNPTIDRRPQSTLTTGHIQKYLLEKVLEYVKDLGL